MTRPEDSIDWERLAKTLSTFAHSPDGGRTEHGSSALARAALEQLLTPAQLSRAVDHYVSVRPGFELVRSVLRLLRPWSAMARCRELYDSSPDVHVRRASVELLRVVADARVIPWIAEFLNDPDEEIQLWGIGILEQLVFSELVEPEQCSALLAQAASHSNKRVRARAAEIGDSFATSAGGSSERSCFPNADLEVESSQDFSTFEVCLHSSPHRGWGTLFVVAVDEGELSWFSQSDEYRESPKRILELNPVAPFDRLPVSEAAVRALRGFLRQIALPALAAGSAGLGGISYSLSVRDGLTEVRWDWWSSLPEVWSQLERVVSYLQRPMDGFPP